VGLSAKSETVDIVKSFRSDNVKYVYSVPHTFFYDKGVGDVEKCCAMRSDLSHVLIADTRNHTKHCRYIVNPPGVDAVVHQHVGVGEGDVDFDALFRTLRDEIAEQTFKVGGEPIVATSLFGYPEKMKYQAVETRELIERELLRR
jgi:myo-inositol catabolism protein IolH